VADAEILQFVVHTHPLGGDGGKQASFPSVFDVAHAGDQATGRPQISIVVADSDATSSGLQATAIATTAAAKTTILRANGQTVDLSTMTDEEVLREVKQDYAAAHKGRRGMGDTIDTDEELAWVSNYFYGSSAQSYVLDGDTFRAVSP